MEIRFENKVAFITGAAGGIGYAAARMFAEAGASVVMADLDSRVTDRAKELEAEGHNAIGIRCDVSDEAQVKAAVEKAVAVFGKLDIAYNNVGIHAAVREDLAETEGWDFDRVILVNLRGVWNCMKYELVEMKKHGKGAIVNCSSQGGLVGIPCIGAYNASKHGVLGLTKSAALEYARQGIRINAICPGTCETPMVRQAIEQSPDHMARVIDAIPLGRVGKAEEIASMVLLLCSDYAGFAIGQTWAMAIQTNAQEMNKVPTVKLNNGMEMPQLGVGTFLVKDDAAERVCHAIKVGFRLFDTAQGYGNEKEVGEGIRRSGIDRRELFITTKVNTTEMRGGTVRQSLDKSLADLGTDYIDLVLIHWPVKGHKSRSSRT